jgi:hypothetical protein
VSGVKSLLSHVCCGALIFAWGPLAGSCANTDLARFAPPGIVKYEDLAGDQPQNPNVAARIAERRAERGGGEFPNLSQTPGAKQRPKPLPAAQVDAQKSELTTARDNLSGAVASDRAAADAETEADLSAESDALKQRVEVDSAAAAQERREKLTAPAPADQKAD